MMRRLRRKHEEADLDITSFMNLMIILVPVLLVMMVFSHITVLDLKLPDLAADPEQNDSDKKQLEVVIKADTIDVNYPPGIRLKQVGKTEEGEYDFKLLSLVLQEVKRRLRDKDIELKRHLEEGYTQKRDILILSQPNTDYQTLVTAMDTVRSFKAVVIDEVVDAELFPQISLGDAPVKTGNKVSAIKGGKQ